jgi:hypothetical protein
VLIGCAVSQLSLTVLEQLKDKLATALVHAYLAAPVHPVHTRHHRSLDLIDFQSIVDPHAECWQQVMKARPATQVWHYLDHSGLVQRVARDLQPTSHLIDYDPVVGGVDLSCSSGMSLRELDSRRQAHWLCFVAHAIAWMPPLQSALGDLVEKQFADSRDPAGASGAHFTPATAPIAASNNVFRRLLHARPSDPEHSLVADQLLAHLWLALPHAHNAQVSTLITETLIGFVLAAPLAAGVAAVARLVRDHSVSVECDGHLRVLAHALAHDSTHRLHQFHPHTALLTTIADKLLVAARGAHGSLLLAEVLPHALRTAHPSLCCE